MNKYITKIEFENYKAFYGKGLDNIINIPDGKNVLIYGENGSGKSSLYEGLRQLFRSSEEEINIKKNIYVDKSVNFPNENKEASVRVTFKENTSTYNEVIFGSEIDNIKKFDFIKKANKLDCFLSYKELLKTYLFDYEDDNFNFEAEFAKVLIEDLLINKQNKITKKKYGAELNELYQRRKKANTKYKVLMPLSDSLVQDITFINVYLNDIIKEFYPDFDVTIKLTKPEIVYGRNPKQNDISTLIPDFKIELDVRYKGIKLEGNNQTHLTILNEAKLSAISISFYLSVLIHYSNEPLDYRILFLDDIFVGLDMSNRIPLLKILQEYRRPIVKSVNDKMDSIQRDEKPFFKEFQIFLTTYDRAWFELSKNNLNNWYDIEMYEGKQDISILENGKIREIQIHKPAIEKSKSILAKALYHERKFDYPASANYLRKSVEELLFKKFKGVVLKGNDGLDLESLDRQIRQVIAFLERINIDAAKFKEIANYAQSLMNPLSHYDLTAPVFKKELFDIRNALQELQNFQSFTNTKPLLEKGKIVTLKLSVNNNIVNNYTFELLDNILTIKTGDECLITNCNVKSIECWETTNGTAGDKINFGRYQKITLEDVIKATVEFENTQNEGLNLPIPDWKTSFYFEDKTIFEIANEK